MNDDELSKLAHDHIYGVKMLPDSRYPIDRTTPLNGVPQVRRPASPDTWREWEWVVDGRPKVNKGIS